MTRWYPLEPADADFLQSAPHIIRIEKHFAAPPQRVWESLASDESIKAWGSSVTHLTWRTARPFGVGTTREVALAPGVLRVRERFFRWEEGRRYSFSVYEANLPVLRRFAEDYAVDADGDGTRFTWTVAIEPKGPLTLPFRPLVPVLRRVFGRTAADGQRYFARQA